MRNLEPATNKIVAVSVQIVGLQIPYSILIRSSEAKHDEFGKVAQTLGVLVVCNNRRFGLGASTLMVCIRI